jgi:hypothetical protein
VPLERRAAGWGAHPLHKVAHAVLSRARRRDPCDAPGSQSRRHGLQPPPQYTRSPPRAPQSPCCALQSSCGGEGDGTRAVDAGTARRSPATWLSPAARRRRLRPCSHPQAPPSPSWLQNCSPAWPRCLCAARARPTSPPTRPPRPPPCRRPRTAPSPPPPSPHPTPTPPAATPSRCRPAPVEQRATPAAAARARAPGRSLAPIRRQCRRSRRGAVGGSRVEAGRQSPRRRCEGHPQAGGGARGVSAGAVLARLASTESG